MCCPCAAGVLPICRRPRCVHATNPTYSSSPSPSLVLSLPQLLFRVLLVVVLHSMSQKGCALLAAALLGTVWLFSRTPTPSSGATVRLLRQQRGLAAQHQHEAAAGLDGTQLGGTNVEPNMRTADDAAQKRAADQRLGEPGLNPSLKLARLRNASESQIRTSIPFPNGNTNLDLRCVLLPAPIGAGCVPTKTRLESRTNLFDPHAMYRPGNSERWRRGATANVNGTGPNTR